MRRNELIEIHDHPRFPTFLRNLVTDALQAIWNHANSYRPILPRLRAALRLSGSQKILDLCSGGGGPWLTLAHDLHRSDHSPICICLTDKYPNAQAFHHARSTKLKTITSDPRPIDAAQVPQDLAGFRTIFSAFHHFSPAEAEKVLADAFDQRQGIAVFEVARPSLKTLLLTCLVPLLGILLLPVIRPFRWSRIFFTLIVPVVPFVLLADGIISCFRTYSAQEMHEMVAKFCSPEYRWEIGEECSGRLPVTYLIGYPIMPVPLSIAS